MTILLQNCEIFDPEGPHHLQKKDILIKNGRFEKIGKTALKGLPENTRVFKDISITKGFVDLFSHFCDPGFEHKEDIESGLKAAALGGYTRVAIMPNTLPAVHSKSEVEYIINKSKGNVTEALPLGAISRDCRGEDITEIYDMHHAGAVAFTDGINSALNAGLTLRALLYVKKFNGLVITHPMDRSLANDGLMNEGTTSTLLGLKGIPSLAEEVVVKRDIQLNEYADSRLHFAYVSTAGSVELIRAAKKKGMKVSCSVSPYNLLFNDSELEDYDSNWKVIPPLRSEKDRKALIRGVQDGTIDTISSFHIPQDIESKQKEFAYAEFGMIGLQTALGLAAKALKDKMEWSAILEKFNTAPAQLLGQKQAFIEEGNTAEITLLDLDSSQLFTETTFVSISKNSPFIGQEFPVRILGTIRNKKSHLSKPAEAAQ